MAGVAIFVVGAVAGWLGGLVTQGNGFGLWGNVTAGVGGAFAGFYLLTFVGMDFSGGIIGAVVTSAIGAFALLFIAGWMRR